MTQLQEPTTRAPAPAHSAAAVGLTMFTAVMMFIIGSFQMIAGLTAVLNDEFFVVTQEWVFKFDVTTWGWIHLILGAVIFLAGLGLFGGQVWARTIGVILAAVSAVLCFAWLPWYPVWSILVIALDVFVIWALTVHGRDIADH